MDWRHEKSAKAGNILVTSRGVPRKHPWSISNEVLNLRNTIELLQADIESLKRVDIFFEILYGLARDGRVKKNGLPKLLQFGVNLDAFHPLANLSGTPVPVQDVLPEQVNCLISISATWFIVGRSKLKITVYALKTITIALFQESHYFIEHLFRIC